MMTCLSQERANSHNNTKPSFLTHASAAGPGSVLQQITSNSRAQSTAGLGQKSIELKSKRLNKFGKLQRVVAEYQMEEADKEEMGNPQACAEYAGEIFDYIKDAEFDTIAHGGYMESIQTDISDKMRAVLVDWLIEVHLKFKLLPETLFLTVNLIDRYLEKHSISRKRLQLLGVTGMLIACKYEEIYPPIVKDFVYITENAYTKEEILAMELAVLTTVDFDVQIASGYRFFERYCKLVKLDDMQANFSRYLIELSLVNYQMLKYPPSMISASSIYLIKKMSKQAEPWPEVIQRASGLTE